jgi:exoribonuclease-2
MERFWTLRYVQQQGLSELTASVLKDKLVRADNLPLVLSLSDGQALPRGTRVRVKLGKIDEITLEVSASVIERLDPPAASSGTPALSETEEGDDEAAPLTIAVALDENLTPVENP